VRASAFRLWTCAKLRSMGLGAPAGFAEIERAVITRAFAGLLYLRILATPVVLGLGFWHWQATGRARLQLVFLCALAAVMSAFLVDIVWRIRRKVLRTLEMGVLGGFDAAIVLASCALTGGLDSPFVIILPVISAVTAMAAEPRWGILAGAVEALGLPLLALAGGTRPVFTIVMVAFGILIGVRSGRVMRGMFQQMLGRALEAREDVLRMHVEQLRTLTTLTGGIAHELKNPLASIKGLTGLALLELDAPARARERLEVLRSEASRMQKILEEFLDFSRPLSPLVLAAVDLRRICYEVAELYQGLAHERRLRILAAGDSAEVRCDSRKIKQVVINLVQNAVEASAEGGEILMEVQSRNGDSIIRVLDRGEGLRTDLLPRIFEPGVTSKARGSGLGLTVCRSLAQQHGGTLALRPREDGGCVAELVLPNSVPVATEAAA